MSQQAPMTHIGHAAGPRGFAGSLNLRPDERAFYDMLFAQADSANTGVLKGSAVKGLLPLSELKKAVLAEVWRVADRSKRNALSREDFYVACRLIALVQNNKPMTLEAVEQFYDTPLPAFTGIQPPFVQTPQVAPPPAAVPQGRPSISGPAAVPPLSQGGAALGQAGEDWSMDPTARSKYLEYFEQADEDKDGFISGAEARKFFAQSTLSPAVLREIWNLADHDKDRQLNRDEFAIAMHLAMKVRRGITLPKELPAALVPRSAAPASAVGLALQGSPSGTPRLEQPPAHPPMSTALALAPVPAPVPVATSAPAPAANTSRAPDIFGSMLEQRNDPPVDDIYAVKKQPAVSTADFDAFGANASDNKKPASAPAPTSTAAPDLLSFEADFSDAHFPSTDEFKDQNSTSVKANAKTAANSNAARGELQRQISEHEQQLQDTKLKQREMVVDLNTAQDDVALEQQRLSELKAQLAAEQKLLAQREETLVALRKELEEMRTQHADVTQQLQHVKDQAGDIQTDTNMVQQEIKQLSSSLASAQELSANQKALIDAQQEQQARLAAQKKELVDQIAKAKQELKELKHQTELLKASNVTAAEENEELQQQLVDARRIVEIERKTVAATSSATKSTGAAPALPAAQVSPTPLSQPTVTKAPPSASAPSKPAPPALAAKPTPIVPPSAAATALTSLADDIEEFPEFEDNFPTEGDPFSGDGWATVDEPKSAPAPAAVPTKGALQESKSASSALAPAPTRAIDKTVGASPTLALPSFDDSQQEPVDDPWADTPTAHTPAAPGGPGQPAALAVTAERDDSEVDGAHDPFGPEPVHEAHANDEFNPFNGSAAPAAAPTVDDVDDSDPFADTPVVVAPTTPAKSPPPLPTKPAPQKNAAPQVQSKAGDDWAGFDDNNANGDEWAQF